MLLCCCVVVIKKNLVKVCLSVRNVALCCVVPSMQTPVYLTPECTVEIHIWRLMDKMKVWYEWALTSPVVSGIHNPHGRSSWIGL